MRDTAPDPGDPYLFALDATSGEVLFRTMLTGWMISEPLVADGMVVIGVASGEVVLYGDRTLEPGRHQRRRPSLEGLRRGAVMDES
jgi:hypothetical protein